MKGIPWLWLLATACGTAEVGADAGVRVRGEAVVGGRIVATVDGEPITVDDVTAAARAAGVPPETALRRLEDELLLAREAGERPGIERAVRQLAVQTLLEREVEARVTSVDPAALEAAYAADPNRFSRPERRRAAHAMASVAEGAPDDAARAWIEELHRELAQAADPLAALLAVRRRPLGDLAFEVVVEELGPIARTDAVDPAFITALFAPAEAGVVLPPVRTRVGWHAIVLLEIEPAEEPSREETMELLRAQRLAALRAQRLEELVRELAADTPVTVDPVGLERAMTSPDLLDSEDAP